MHEVLTQKLLVDGVLLKPTDRFQTGQDERRLHGYGEPQLSGRRVAVLHLGGGRQR